MSWKNAETTGLSLRGRMVLSTFLTTGCLSILATVVVTVIAYRYMIGDVEEKLNRISDDLQAEYRQFGGLSPAFRHCIDEDAEEHNPNKTFILVTDATNAVRYATQIPPGFRDRLVRLTRRAWTSGRFYTEREGLEDASRHGAVRFTTRPLPDGGNIVLACDVSDVEAFLIFLVSTLGGVSALITILSCISAYIVGGRILRLNQLVAEKNAAYTELRHLTDDISHDLRTPLTRLSMAAETEMTGGSLPEPLAVQVHTETDVLLNLINTMLEISQTDAKIERTPRENIDLAAFVRRACDLYAPAIEDAGLNLETRIPEGPVQFSGHKGKVQQLLGNLIDNAIKFTPRGGSISVVLDKESSVIKLSVSDTGCGIAPADIPFVFKRFWRADSSRHQPGNGLGLALVQAIVTSYGGRIVCASEVGHGTTFTVSLPI